MFKKSFPIRRLWRYSPLWPSESFIVSPFIFKSLIHLDLIFLCDVKSGSYFIFYPSWCPIPFPTPVKCVLSEIRLCVHESVSGFALLSHQSIYPPLYQNHSMQMYLNSYWLRPCSLGIRRLKLVCNQISKDLENQLEKPGLDLESKGVPQHVRKQKREILNEHLRKTFLGVKSSLSMGEWGWEKNVGVTGVLQG